MGLAVLATLAATVTRDSRSAAHSIRVALTAGYDRAFLVAGLLLFIGAGLALLIRSEAPAPASSTAGVVNPLPAAVRFADDGGHGHDPASRHVHRGRQAV